MRDWEGVSGALWRLCQALGISHHDASTPPCLLGNMFPTIGDVHLAPFTDEQLYMEQFTKANFW